MTTTTACDWEKRWQIADTLWDKGRASPALVSFLKDHGDLIPSQGIGLVPGCGAGTFVNSCTNIACHLIDYGWHGDREGYDVLLLSTPDRHMTGLDMSPTCIAKVKKDYPEGNYDFICDDFYKFQIPQRGYDLVYDYTFLCAMPPVMRPQWSSRMAEIIRPGGVLIALMYPLEEREGGPPFGLSEEVYMELLGDNFENIYLADARGHPNRIGREKMSVWKRK